MGLNEAAGLAYTEAEWISEWQGIVDMASRLPRHQMSTASNEYYQSLEEVLLSYQIYLNFRFNLKKNCKSTTKI